MDGHSRIYVSARVIYFCEKSAEETEKKWQYAELNPDFFNPILKIVIRKEQEEEILSPQKKKNKKKRRRKTEKKHKMKHPVKTFLTKPK